MLKILRKKPNPTVVDNVNLAIDYLNGLQWVDGRCAWCGNSQKEGHKANCPYHNALESIEGLRTGS
jgi:hypothetical protein